MTKNFSTNACYSVINAGFSGNNSDDALLRIVIGLIEIKHYSKINIREVCADFKQEFHFEIPYFPMQRILGLASSKQYITYNGVGVYSPNYSKICKEKFMEALEQEQSKYNSIIDSFLSFALLKHKKTYTKEEASKVIDSFVEENGLLFYKNRTISTSEQNFIFKEFLISSQEKNMEVFNFVDSLIIGRILAEYVTYHEPSEKSVDKKMIAYVDTGFAFRILGIDNLSRQDIYKTLVQDMIDTGIQVKMFNHSYNEMINIINNSSMWIDNPNYDPSKATEATYYFVTNDYSREKITELSIKAKSQLLEYGILVDDSIEYPQTLPIGVPYEKKLYDDIIEFYKQSNPHFNEEDKRYTVEQDARSFFYISYLCEAIYPSQISDIKYIFISTNKSLARLSKKLISQCQGTSTNTIPFCVSDVFWGTVLWANTPAKLISTSKSRLASELYSAFIPTPEMLKKLTQSLIECEAQGQLTADECYMLKASKLANRTLMEVTLGNEDSFEEKTPIMILQNIQAIAKDEGANEERRIAAIKIKEKEQEILQEKLKRIESNIVELKYNISLQEDRLKLLKDQKPFLSDKLVVLDSKKTKVTRTIDRNIRLFILVFILIMVIYAFVGFLIWRYQGKEDYFEIYKFLMPLLSVISGYAYFAMAGKAFNVFSWTKNYRKNSKSIYYKKYDYSDNDVSEIKNKIDSNENIIVEIGNELESLHKRLNAYESEKEQISQAISM